MAIDLNEDVKETAYSPLVLYIYQMSKYNEKKLIRESFAAKSCSQEFDNVIRSYSSDLLKRIKEYVDGVQPSRSRTKSLKDRTYKIIGMGLAIAENAETAKEYEKFYNHDVDISKLQF